MNKKLFWYGVLSVALLAEAQSTVAGGLGVRGGMLTPVAGSYNATLSTAELLDRGSSYGLFLRQQVGKHYGIEAAVDLGWAAFAPEHRQEQGMTPHFVLPAVTFSNVLRLPLGPVAPYGVAGVGIFPWRFTRDGLNGDPVSVEGEALQKMSAGITGGAGIELRLTRWLSLFGEARVASLLSRDRFLFGEHFSEQTMLTVNTGVVFSPWGQRR
ncbi:MAG: hypothetical protein NUW13_08210 [candidate division KSB1 bacterium]|jgi:hypothetical protein|nr:hypothetical protein [candidate division KSB1 bacterium]